MIRLTATRMSDDMLQTLNGHALGRVHSVFESAMNVQMDDGTLITLLTAKRGLYPRSVQLAETVSFMHMGLLPDCEVRIAPYVIRLGDRAAVDAQNALPVSLCMPVFGPVVDPAEYGVRMSALAAAIAGAEDMTEGLAPVLCELFPDIPYTVEHNVWSRFLTGRIRRLYDALCRCERSICVEIGRSVAGCGPGLTPSSDDCLIGVFAALYGASSAGILDGATAGALCQNLAAGAIPGTGTISAALLKSGAAGNFGEEVLRLISAFFVPAGREALPQLAARVCAAGSTSGVDTLVGIWLGLAACFQQKGCMEAK